MKQRSEDFFLISDNANSHHAFKFWLKKRDFNDFEMGRPDRKGNPIIKLMKRTDDHGFSKQGIVCCVNGAEQTAQNLIQQHLREEVWDE